MSTASKFIFDPIKTVLGDLLGTVGKIAGQDNALSQLGSAQKAIDSAVQTVVSTGVEMVLNLLPTGAGLKIEILTDIIAGLNAALVDINTASVTSATGNTTTIVKPVN